VKVWQGEQFLSEVPEKRLQDLAPFEDTARRIIEDVRERRDQAVLEYTARFDGKASVPRSIRVAPEEVKEAYSRVNANFLEALSVAKGNVAKYHREQVRTSWMTLRDDGTVMGQVVSPIERVGLYVPGGTAAYPSTVLMGVLPAKIAGVPRVTVCTPPLPGGKVNPHVLVAADLCGADLVCKAGGVQAVAAMAFGTESIPAVDKIVGPGNGYVTAAKKLLYGIVDIDMLAGPSEVMIVAGQGADPVLVAADLLSQAEHDALSAAIVVTWIPSLVQRIQAEIARQLETLPRRGIATESLEKQGAIVVVRDLDEAIHVVNHYAPEHLELMVEVPFTVLPRVRNAGAVFLGPYSPVAVGDYGAGPNHVLPTSGTARSSSALSVQSFTRATSFLAASPEFLKSISPFARKLASVEGLEGHSRALEMRGDRK